MSYTSAILSIPRAAWDYIADAFAEVGQHGRHAITIGPDDAPTVAIDMEGISVIPTGDRDMFINSGRLSDLLVQAGEEAFRAGYEAAGGQGSYYEAWGNYEPSEDIMDLQAGL